MKAFFFICVTFLFNISLLYSQVDDFVEDTNYVGDYNIPIDVRNDSLGIPIDINEVNGTEITPVLEINIIDTVNLIYCSSFEIAWNKIRDEIAHEPINMIDPPSWLPIMNRLESNTSISDSSILAMTGFLHENIISKFNQELQERFGFTMDTDIDTVNGDSAIVSLAFLNKEVFFKKDLDDHGNWFGYQYFDRIDTIVRIHDFHSVDDFILQIQTENANEEFFIAKIPVEKSLKETYEKTMERIEKNNIKHLAEGTVLWIPKIQFNLINNFKELEGKIIKYKNLGGGTPYRINLAKQIVRFSLNELGATLQSKVSILESIFAVPQLRLVFKEKYLIIMKERNNKEPYFVMWVGNDELYKKD